MFIVGDENIPRRDGARQATLSVAIRFSSVTAAAHCSGIKGESTARNSEKVSKIVDTLVELVGIEPKKVLTTRNLLIFQFTRFTDFTRFTRCKRKLAQFRVVD